MKQKFKNYLKLGLLFFGISFVLTNCQKDDLEQNLETNLKENGHNDIVKIASLKEFKELNTYVEDRENKIASRTTTEDTNGFTILENEDVVQKTVDGRTTYTLQIIRDDQPDDSFSNLVVKFEDDQPTLALVLNYFPTEDFLSEYEYNKDAVFSGQFSSTQIDYDGFLDSHHNQRQHCVTTHSQWCNWSESGAINPHPAGEECSVTYTISNTICWESLADYIAASEDDDVTNGTGGGGAGGGTTNTNNNPHSSNTENGDTNTNNEDSITDEGGDIVDTNPLPVKPEVDPHLAKLKELSDNIQIKEKIDSLKSKRDGNREYGFQFNLANATTYNVLEADLAEDNGGVKFPTPTVLTVAEAHLHENGRDEVFSGMDVYQMTKLVKKSNSSNATGILVTKNHIVALRIKDIEKAKAYYDSATTWGEASVKKDYKNTVIKGANNDAAAAGHTSLTIEEFYPFLLKRFLYYLDIMDTGLTLYVAILDNNGNIIGWKAAN